MKTRKNPKIQRIFMMIFGAFAIFFTGYPHIWSIYQPYVMEVTGWTLSQTSLCFYLALFTFVFGNIAGGKLQDRYSPRAAILWGGGLITVGVLASAFALRESPILIYITYGIVQGFGHGMVYTTIISTAQKWFPDKTGFASGIVVTANGLCGFFLAPISRVLLAGGGPQRAFLVIGIFIGISWILGSIFVVNPEETNTKEKNAKDGKEEGAVLQNLVTRQYTTVEMLHTKKFYLLMGTMACGLISYFIVSPLSQNIQIERGVGAGIAVSAVMLGSIVNAAARLVLPTMADKIGRIPCLKVVLVIATLCMGLLMVSTSYVTTIAIILTYGCYGGILGSFPSIASSIFGMKYSGANYGLVMLGFGIASLLAPLISNTIMKLGIALNGAFSIGAVFALAGVGMILLLDRELKTEKRILKEEEHVIV